ncbi:MAG: hypothetical protein R3Y60_01790 [bacterium]
MKKKIICNMIDMGFKPELKGFEYILHEVLQKIKGERFFVDTNKKLSKKRDTNEIAIERSIRYSISISNKNDLKNSQVVKLLQEMLVQ